MSQPVNPQQPSDPFAEFGGTASTSPAPADATTPPSPSDPFAEFGGTAVPQETDPHQTGEIVNDVGNTVIVPKDGESFADTVKRATTRWKSLTPEQQRSAIDAETATMPKKVPETLAAAAGIGVAGPALLATAGEAGNALYELAVKHLAGNVLPGMEEEAAKAKLLEWAPKVLKAAKELGIGAGGIGLLWKAVTSQKAGQK